MDVLDIELDSLEKIGQESETNWLLKLVSVFLLHAFETSLSFCLLLLSLILTFLMLVLSMLLVFLLFLFLLLSHFLVHLCDVIEGIITVIPGFSIP